MTDTTMSANFTKLPEFCAAKNLETGETIIIKRGELGYWPATGVDINSFNKERGVTARQREAMFAGSLFGFGTPGANPENPCYDRAEEVPA